MKSFQLFNSDDIQPRRNNLLKSESKTTCNANLNSYLNQFNDVLDIGSSNILSEIQDGIMSDDEDLILSQLSKASLLFVSGVSTIPEPDSDLYHRLIYLSTNSNRLVAQQSVLLLLNLFIFFPESQNFLKPELFQIIINHASEDEIIAKLCDFLKKYPNFISTFSENNLFEELITVLTKNDDVYTYNSSLRLITMISELTQTQEKPPIGIEFSHQIFSITKDHALNYSKYTAPTLKYYRSVLPEVIDDVINSGIIEFLIENTISFNFPTLEASILLISNSINESTVQFFIESNLISLIHAIFCHENTKSIEYNFILLCNLAQSSEIGAICQTNEPISTDIISHMSDSFNCRVYSTKLFLELIKYKNRDEMINFLGREENEFLFNMVELLQLEFDPTIIPILEMFLDYAQQSQIGKHPLFAKFEICMQSEEFSNALDNIMSYHQDDEDVLRAIEIAEEISKIIES
ncbi:hypothetical protein TVAG_387650 [Trichomonas vaginalis G3]|uniref:Uncharacterized protein n=1 Tax=Trichomonas vaginalis (strain ATCC PRA-98 / G3) TaxID=412133 RepID=A2E0Z2_TRIV3|nr:armadillo (ARM) repeat-containing protein family [Trichomonas vaginalis G3]EAY13624.1 hypothetical protein TVAG_387650 [Trichomonas vaginalis G3]KAI5529891.1 armadillo (ARM) repeat-containing protein family [Trichomonas vaginalis G3]|eukprot:XP_001325847.1 hypothetical protein [Trichomonas vaginalis G3]